MRRTFLKVKAKRLTFKCLEEGRHPKSTVSLAIGPATELEARTDVLTESVDTIA